VVIGFIYAAERGEANGKAGPPQVGFSRLSRVRSDRGAQASQDRERCLTTILSRNM